MAKNNRSEFVTLQDAAQMVGLPLETLTRLVETDRIRAVRFNGEMLISTRQARKARLLHEDEKAKPCADKRQFKNLEGNPIHLSEAARKYHIAEQSLSRWVRSGHLRVIGKDPNHKTKVIVDESDVAYAEALIRARGGHRQGSAVFR